MATASTDQKILHHSVLEFESKEANVTLTTHYIAVECPVKYRSIDPGLDVKAPTTCQVIPLDEIIAVQSHNPSPKKDKFKHQDGSVKYKAIEMQPMNPTHFVVYVIKRGPKHRWRHKMLVFSCKDPQSCSQWIEKIRDALFTLGTHRPRRLLIFINPYGGKKKAPKVYERVRPLFELAGVQTDVLETQHQNHAREHLQTYDLSSVDGVVAVGGDGTFSEILNGLLDRCNADEGVEQSFRHVPVRPRLRLGVIPAGSTDAIVHSTTGTIDPVTSALQIIIGDGVGVDVNALYKKEKFVKYSVIMTSYGYYGDLLADSENFRWMGPKRYNWSGFKKFMSNKAYEGEVAFLPAEQSSGNPQDGTRCLSGCVTCQRAGNESRSISSSSSVPSFDLGDKDDDDDPQTRRWQRVPGKFITINAMTICCRSPLSPEGMSPSAHLGDGCIDLVLVSGCSRFDYLRHLSRIPRAGADQFDFSFIQVHRVREIQFRPAQDDEEEKPVADSDSEGASVSLSSTGSTKSLKSMKSVASSNSMWNCDGEVIAHPHLHIQVHCQLIRMFARGIEDRSKPELEKCPVCCNPCSRF